MPSPPSLGAGASLRVLRDAMGTPPCGPPAGTTAAAGTWTDCAPWPRPATELPPGGWPICWSSGGDLDGAAQISRALAEAGDEVAGWRLVGLLAWRFNESAGPETFAAKAVDPRSAA